MKPRKTRADRTVDSGEDADSAEPAVVAGEPTLSRTRTYARTS